MKPCGAKLADGQWWAFCGETDMGQGSPVLCEVCDVVNGLKRKESDMKRISKNTLFAIMGMKATINPDDLPDCTCHERSVQCTMYKEYVTELFRLLDIEEESDGGRVFHPNYISSCRVMDAEKIDKVLSKLRRLRDETT